MATAIVSQPVCPAVPHPVESTKPHASVYDRETDANFLGFIETAVQFELHAGVEFGHCLGLVSHPEVVYVFLTPLTSQPCLAEPTKGMEAHPLFVYMHGLKSRRQPSSLKIVVQARCAIPGREQQSIFAASISNLLILGIATDIAGMYGSKSSRDLLR